MNYGNYFKDMIQSIPDYRKIVLILFLIRIENDLLTECEVLQNDINRLIFEFKNILMEQNEDYLDYIKNQEESIIEKILSK